MTMLLYLVLWASPAFARWNGDGDVPTLAQQFHRQYGKASADWQRANIRSTARGEIFLGQPTHEGHVVRMRAFMPTDGHLRQRDVPPSWYCRQNLRRHGRGWALKRSLEDGRYMVDVYCGTPSVNASLILDSMTQQRQRRPIQP